MWSDVLRFEFRNKRETREFKRFLSRHRIPRITRREILGKPCILEIQIPETKELLVKLFYKCLVRVRV